MIREKCQDVDNKWTILQFENQEISRNTKQYLEDIVKKELHPVLVDTTFDLEAIYTNLLHIYHLLNE
jgi:tyrosine-protein phosphatase YwqE